MYRGQVILLVSFANAHVPKKQQKSCSFVREINNTKGFYVSMLLDFILFVILSFYANVCIMVFTRFVSVYIYTFIWEDNIIDIMIFRDTLLYSNHPSNVDLGILLSCE